MLSEFFERRRLDEKSGAGLLGRGLGVYESSAGVVVNSTTALQSTAVFACMRILAESVASLPLIPYRRLPTGGKARAQSHYLYAVLHGTANEEMTSYDLRELQMVHLALRGTAFSYLEFDQAGRIRSIWPLNPDKSAILRDQNNQLFYGVELPERLGGEWRILAANQVWRIRGLGTDPLVGMNPIQYARNAIGLGLATEEFGARFFQNGAQPGFVLKHPNKLSDEAYERLKKSWEKQHRGLTNAHKAAILEEGMGVEKIGVAPEDAQFLETRKFQTTEIARLFRVPPHMLADLDRATFANIEHMSLEFVKFSLQPWLTRIEASAEMQLLTPSERSGYFIEHLVDGLLRGDTTARYAAYHSARQDGWMSANDIRELENMNPIEGGDVYLVPLNMIPANQVGDLGGSTESAPVGRSSVSTETALPGQALIPGPSSINGRGETSLRWAQMDRQTREARSARSAVVRHRLQRSYWRIFKDLGARMLRREAHDVKDAARRWLKARSVSDFERWLTDFYQDHKGYIERQMGAPVQAYSELVAAEAVAEVNGDAHDAEVERFALAYIRAYAGRHAGNHELRLKKTIQRAQESGADMLEAIEAELDAMEASVPEEIANEESVRANNAVAKLIYGLSAVTILRWFSFGENCPYCNSLDGMTVAIESNFIDQGAAFQPEGADVPLNPGRDIGHPPAHKGCDCMITAG